jgi:hypothetical protein
MRLCACLTDPPAGAEVAVAAIAQQADCSRCTAGGSLPMPEAHSLYGLGRYSRRGHPHPPEPDMVGPEPEGCRDDAR